MIFRARHSGGRGRKTEEAQRLKAFANTLSAPDAKTFERPQPPSYLTESQCEIWREVVSRLPPDWFPPETLPLLEQYCYHILEARELGKRINNFKIKTSKDEDKRDKLVRKQMALTNILSMLATRMRLTQQSLVDRRRQRQAMVEDEANGFDKKPWEAMSAVVVGKPQ